MPDRTPCEACFGALALELRPGERAARTTLERSGAAELAAGIAHDLASFVPEAATLDLAVAATHYDPVEMLRPGWPPHAALVELARRAPASLAGAGAAAQDGSGRLLAFGAHAGVLPDALPPPEPDFSGGALRLVPFVLRGADAGDRVARVADALEEILLDRGMAGAATALFAQQAFGAPIEHARYLTIHDLAAMMAMQYEHAGLGVLWPLIEAALLAPASDAWLDAPPEPLARYAEGQVRIALLDADAWRTGGFAPLVAADDPDRLERAFGRFEVRQRQIAAVLAAHGIPVTFDHCPDGRDARALLAS